MLVRQVITNRTGSVALRVASSRSLVVAGGRAVAARASHSSAGSSTSTSARATQAGRFALVGAGALALYATAQTLHAEAPSERQDGPAPSVASETDLTYTTMTQQEQMRERTRRQGVYAWGSNRYNVVAPDSPSTTLVKTPRSIPYFDGMALRDIVLEEKHGVAVDANGDVLQWGLGFFDPSARDIQQGSIEDVPLARRREKARANELQPKGELAASRLSPVRTLVGKDIVRVVANDTKVFALSRKGEVYVFSALQTLQSPPKANGWSANPLSLFGAFAGSTIAHEKLSPVVPLKSGEKVAQLEGGSSHILMLTNKGRVLTTPTDQQGNDFGQLGTRRVRLNAPKTPENQTGYVETIFNPQMLELEGPRAPRPATRLPDWALPPSITTIPDAPVAHLPQAKRPKTEAELVGSEEPLRISFCTTMHEVPALRGVEIASIASGQEHCLARTPTGLVLGWGRQSHGQLGLRNNLGLEAVVIPSEIPLGAKQCTSITAGGQNTFFVMEKRDSGASPSSSSAESSKIDVMAAGVGTYGQLGNAQWTQVTSAGPVRTKTVSGLLEYSESAEAVLPVPIHHITIGRPGHVAIVLDTVDYNSLNSWGRDVMVHGHNSAWQLGNGKRSNLCVPQHLKPLPPLTPSAGAEAPVAPEMDPSMIKRIEADMNSGVLTHMPHNRLQLAGAVKAETHAAPSENGKPGSKRKAKVEEHIVAGAVSMSVYWKILDE